MKQLVLIFSLISVFKNTSAQQLILGRVSSSGDNQPIAGCIVQLLKTDSTLVKATSSNAEGFFQLEDIAEGNYLIKVGILGFTPQWKSLVVAGEPARAGMFRLEPASKELATQEVEAAQVRTEQKGDTTQFNAGAFKTNPDATLEDLVKKMPGMVVENGQVKVGGEQVQKITIDGKEFFGDDASMALRNLPAEVVDKIQVFDRLSDQAQFTGFDDGNSRKGMNVITRGGMKNAEFGKLFGGYGTEDRYNTGLTYNKFKGNRKFTFLGQSNNVNVQNFSSQDLVGLTGGGGGGGMGGGRGGAGGGGM
ncbi:MAG: carboxypeptidase regulatory-like domain-containing protein, partial [Bacteroidia bacterium]